MPAEISGKCRFRFSDGARLKRQGVARAGRPVTLVSEGRSRALGVASYTWIPGMDGAVVPEGADLDSVIYNFYRAPGLVRELKDAGARAVFIAADKPHAILYTAPVEFSATGRVAALPTVSLAHEDDEGRRTVARGGNLEIRMKAEG